MIHYISPFRCDKNIGKSINNAITEFISNDNDWICHLDQDVLWLLPDSKKQLEEILSTTDFDILGMVTNRLGQQHQLVQGMYNEPDISKHIEIAKKMQNLNGNDIIETKEILAAFCLCFKVKTWKSLGMFVENAINFDAIFSICAIKDGYKLGICPGIYLFHLYRWGSDNPSHDIKHLLP